MGKKFKGAFMIRGKLIKGPNGEIGLIHHCEDDTWDWIPQEVFDEEVTVTIEPDFQGVL